MWIFFPLSTKANLNLCQTGLKDLGIKAIKWLLSALKPPPSLKCQTRVVQYHLTLDHVIARWRACITSPDRSDYCWRIHPCLAQSNPTLFRKHLKWEIQSDCAGTAWEHTTGGNVKFPLADENSKIWEMECDGGPTEAPARSPASWCSPFETVLMERSYSPTWEE